MALGKQNKIDGKAISLRLELKDGKKFLEIPRFGVQEKQPDGEYKSVRFETDVSGDLFKIEPRKWEHEGKTNYSYKLALRDNDPEVNEAYYVEVSLGSGLGRGLANSILNLEAFDKIEIGLYGQENKAKQKTFPAVSLRQGGKKDTVKWKFDPKAPDSPVPPPRVYEGPDGPANDFKAQQIFFFEKLTEFAKTVEEEAKKLPKSAPAKAAAPKAAQPGAQENLDEDPPF